MFTSVCKSGLIAFACPLERRTEYVGKRFVTGVTRLRVGSDGDEPSIFIREYPFFKKTEFQSQIFEEIKTLQRARRLEIFRQAFAKPLLEQYIQIWKKKKEEQQEIKRKERSARRRETAAERLAILEGKKTNFLQSRKTMEELDPNWNDLSKPPVEAVLDDVDLYNTLHPRRPIHIKKGLPARELGLRELDMFEDDEDLNTYDEKLTGDEEIPFEYHGPSDRMEALEFLKSKSAIVDFIKEELSEFGFPAAPDDVTESEWLESKKTKNRSNTTTTAVKDEYPLMFSSSKRFVEPEPFPDRKVIMKVKVGALKLSSVARKRLIGLLGPRYHFDTATLPIDNHATTAENKFYAKRLLRALLGEAWLADSHYIPLQPSPVDYTEDTTVFKTEETWEEEYKKKRDFWKKPIWFGSKHVFYHFGHAHISA